MFLGCPVKPGFRALGTSLAKIVATLETSPVAAITGYPISQLGPDAPFLLAGGCDDDRYLDAGEAFSLQIQFVNTEPVELVDALATLEAFDGDGTGAPSSYVVIDEPAKPIGALVSQRLQVQRTSFGVRVAGVPPGRQRETFRVCIKSPPAGQGVGSCVLFQFLLQADDEKHYYITDCPSGCTGVSFDRNNDEIIETLVSDNPYFDVMNRRPQESVGIGQRRSDERRRDALRRRRLRQHWLQRPVELRHGQRGLPHRP